jgi:hypothetical protein
MEENVVVSLGTVTRQGLVPKTKCMSTVGEVGEKEGTYQEFPARFVS